MLFRSPDVGEDMVTWECDYPHSLIEYANGDARKTVWGKKRAEAGHPKPFNLKFIGIGNEDMITPVFVEQMCIRDRWYFGYCCVDELRTVCTILSECSYPHHDTLRLRFENYLREARKT